MAMGGRDTANSARFVHQHDEEYDEVKSARRAGRPASAQEDLLRMKVETLEKEYRDGFCRFWTHPLQNIPADHSDMPDLTSEANVQMLSRFEGSWTFLNSLTWVKVSAAGNVKPSSFPPQGL